MPLGHELMSSNEHGIINIQQQHSDSELRLFWGLPAAQFVQT